MKYHEQYIILDEAERKNLAEFRMAHGNIDDDANGSKKETGIKNKSG